MLDVVKIWRRKLLKKGRLKYLGGDALSSLIASARTGVPHVDFAHAATPKAFRQPKGSYGIGTHFRCLIAET